MRMNPTSLIIGFFHDETRKCANILLSFPVLVITAYGLQNIWVYVIYQDKPDIFIASL